MRIGTRRGLVFDDVRFGLRGGLTDCTHGVWASAEGAVECAVDRARAAGAAVIEDETDRHEGCDEGVDLLLRGAARHCARREARVERTKRIVNRLRPLLGYATKLRGLVDADDVQAVRGY